MHVCVLGAGIAGLSTAWQLAQAGHSITLVDRAEPAAGASAANGGQLSYAHVQPLASPSLWLQLPGLLLSAASPLRLRPRLDPLQWEWALRFLLACNAARSAATTQHLLELGALSQAAFEAFRRQAPADLDFTSAGKLVLYRSEAAMRSAIRQMRLQQALGGPLQQAVTASEALAIEPALAAAPGLAGAIYTPGECAADCRKVCDALASALLRQGARCLWNTAVQGFERRGGAVSAVSTSRGPITADAFVLSLGDGSAAAGRWLGLRLPVYPLKGYSITLPIEDESAAPRVSVTDSARKMVFARLGRRLRVAGCAELVGCDTGIPPERIRQLVEATGALFPGSCLLAPNQAWSGLRPATPTGVPLVGRHPDGPRNVLLNTGHGALGFTLAFGTAQRVAEALRDGMGH